MISFPVLFDRKLLLAPLAGVTDSIFRKICRRLGADVVWSEMVSADGLVFGDSRTGRYLDFSGQERPIGIQLFGSDPSVMARAARIAARREPEFIDLNFGCPVRKVVRKNGGAALMRDPDLIGKIASAVVESVTPLPVSAKIRTGWNESQVNYEQVSRRLVDAGVQALVLHPRTREQGFSGTADWGRVAHLARISQVPVAGSGDVFSPEDAAGMLAETGCSAVMIGRGAMGNPWIFRRARCILDGAADPGGPSLGERFDLMLGHAEMMARALGERNGIVAMRKHFGWYTRGLPESAGLRRRLFEVEGLAEAVNIIGQYMQRRQCTPTG